jgi:Resolvase, N terminal domain
MRVPSENCAGAGPSRSGWSGRAGARHLQGSSPPQQIVDHRFSRLRQLREPTLYDPLALVLRQGKQESDVPCEVYRERASGKATKDRPQLEKAIDALGTGDVLVVAEWDRATRSMMDGVHIIERIHARSAMIKVLDKPHLDLTTPIGRGFKFSLQQQRWQWASSTLWWPEPSTASAAHRLAADGRAPAYVSLDSWASRRGWGRSPGKSN